MEEMEQSEIQVIKISENYKIKDKYGYSILCKKDIHHNSLSITPKFDTSFLFINSHPDTVKAIGNLLVQASKL